MTARPAPVESRIAVNGIELCVFDWQAAGPTLFFAHATGFHARCWDATIEALPEFRCVAVDMRGHGRSTKLPPPEAYAWGHYADDVTALLETMDLHAAVAIGHSKGGYAVARAAGRLPGRIAALLLVDPVIQPRAQYQAPPATFEHFAARRRNEWPSAQEMFDRFRDRQPFASWDQRVLRDYCEFGLLPAPGGDGFVLACPPAIEAATYSGAATADPYDDIARVQAPARILRAKARTAEVAMDMSGSPTAPDLASHFARGEDVPLPQYSHFMPMEDPQLIASHIRELIAAAG